LLIRNAVPKVLICVLWIRIEISIPKEKDIQNIIVIIKMIDNWWLILVLGWEAPAIYANKVFFLILILADWKKATM